MEHQKTVYSGQASRPRINTKEIRKNKVSDDNLVCPSCSTTSSINKDMVYTWFTNADTLTQAKIQELENEIQSSASAPDIIAVTEIKPKNYVRNITENDYKIKGYRVEHANLSDKGSTRGVAIYISVNLCNATN